MTFKHFLGIGIATIIYGLCAVGWAEVKPVDPALDCKTSIVLNVQSNIAKILGGYKTNATFTNGQYVFCFNQTDPFAVLGPIVFQPASGDSVVIYGLKIAEDVKTLDPSSWTNKTLLAIIGSNVLLQNLQLTGPGSSISGSIGVSLNGSTLSIIDSTITGFETGVKADCVSPAPQPPPIEGGGGANCIIGPQNVIEDVKLGVVLPTTSQGVTITQNEIRTVFDLDSTTQKIFLNGVANGGLTPPTFSIDPATATIWKTLSEDKKFVTEIGGVLPKSGTIELFEHHPAQQPDLTYKYTDYFRNSCPTTQNDKGLWEFKCTGLNIDAAIGQVFVDVTYSPNTSAMTPWINVKDIPDKQYIVITPAGAFTPETVQLAGGGDSSGSGLNGIAASPSAPRNDLGGSDAIIPDAPMIGEAEAESGGGSAMSGGAMLLGADAGPSAAGGCGLMMPGIPTAPGVMLWWLAPVVVLWYRRLAK